MLIKNQTNTARIIQGRMVSEKDINQINQLLAEHRDWSRRRLSTHLCKIWNWRNSRDQLKDMACRSLLLKLEKSGYIRLPARRCQPSNRMRQKKIEFLPHCTGPIECELNQLRPLRVVNISKAVSLNSSRSASTQAVQSHLPDHHQHYQSLFDFFLFKYHYLSYKGPVGENLKYLVFDSANRPLCCLLFSSSAWKLSCRDKFIGWDITSRERNVNLIANNMRFLILPWIRVENLASFILGQVLKRLGNDWIVKYNHPIYLVETFVQRDRFLGTCYKASNWIYVGQTTGRSRNDRYMKLKVPVKDVYLYPLEKDFRKYLMSKGKGVIS